MFVVSLSVGPYHTVGIREVLGFLTGGLEPAASGVVEYRLHRTIAAAVTGLALSASGLAIQYSLRNPLADPYIMGVSSTAALAVLGFYYLTSHPSPWQVYTVAFMGGLAGVAASTLIAILLGLSGTALIVAGVSVSYLAGGLSMILALRLGDKVPMALSWLFGTVAYTVPNEILYSSVGAVAGVVWIALLSRRMNTLILGEEAAEGLGARVRMLRVEAAVAASLATSSVVALAGPVGFIGLAGPWLARLLAGAVFTRVLPVALASGALLTIISDIIVRLVGGGEIPLTAVTSVYGGLVLYYLVARGRSL